MKSGEIAESVASGRKFGAEMARLCNISQPTVTDRRPVAHRSGLTYDFEQSVW
jgi:hypothetical protein